MECEQIGGQWSVVLVTRHGATSRLKTQSVFTQRPRFVPFMSVRYSWADILMNEGQLVVKA